MCKRRQYDNRIQRLRKRKRTMIATTPPTTEEEQTHCEMIKEAVKGMFINESRTAAEAEFIKTHIIQSRHIAIARCSSYHSTSTRNCSSSSSMRRKSISKCYRMKIQTTDIITNSTKRYCSAPIQKRR